MSDSAAEWVGVDALIPWADNPRNNEAAVQTVADSIKRFGFASPIIARRADGEVIAGHTRLKAARRLGLDRVPVRYMDLDPTDARLLALADNKLGELAEWSDGLADVLRILEEDGADLDGLGFSDEEMSELLAPPALDLDDEDGTPDLDVIPDDVPAITQPGEVIELGRHTLHCGDCLEVMRSLPDASVHAVVTDPPYGIGFMGKGWDCAVPGIEWARECLRVLRPGGHVVAFGGTRTIHRLTSALEDAGFEIRDQIGWLQWQGFPKSHSVANDIDKRMGCPARGRAIPMASTHLPSGRYRDERLTSHTVEPYQARTPEGERWASYGTALKPATEPAVLARKPPEGTIAENVLAHGAGALNIDGCRYAYGDPAWPGPSEKDWRSSDSDSTTGATFAGGSFGSGPSDLGRWPANIYATPKASRGEREEGCERLTSSTAAEITNRKPGSAGLNSPRAGIRAGSVGRNPRTGTIRNIHPTVKPAKLMQWLVRLVGCQPGSVILEPFAGSGTTMVAAEVEGFTCIGIEMEPAYCDIARARVSHHMGWGRGEV